jgi:peptidyl-prolyl cis-trans isomerase D
MEVGELRTLDSPDGLIVVRLNAITEPATDDPEVTALKAAITAQLSSGISQDVFAAYAQALQGMYPTQINQQALNAVHANFQ